MSDALPTLKNAPWQMGVAALAAAASGLIAQQAQPDIMQLCQGVKPPMNSSRAALRLVPGLFGLGLGLFLAALLMPTSQNRALTFSVRQG